MEVKIISTTSNPIQTMWVAARTCYSSLSPIEMLNNEGNYESKLNLVKSVLQSGHMSIAEHINFTFAIEGISRACSHQLVRHRLCTFSQQSQRYVEIKEDSNTLYDLISGFPTDEKIIKMKEIAEKYFVDVNDNNYFGYVHDLWQYTSRIAAGEKAEDARNSLPNATKTNIVLTTNFRNLIHIAELRLCVRAQKEIRELFKLIKKEVTNNNPILGNMLLAQCDRLGYCPEASKCCGRKQKLEDIINGDNTNRAFRQPQTSMT